MRWSRWLHTGGQPTDQLPLTSKPATQQRQQQPFSPSVYIRARSTALFTAYSSRATGLFVDVRKGKFLSRVRKKKGHPYPSLLFLYSRYIRFHPRSSQPEATRQKPGVLEKQGQVPKLGMTWPQNKQNKLFLVCVILTDVWGSFCLLAFLSHENHGVASKPIHN